MDMNRLLRKPTCFHGPIEDAKTPWTDSLTNADPDTQFILSVRSKVIQAQRSLGCVDGLWSSPGLWTIADRVDAMGVRGRTLLVTTDHGHRRTI